MQNIELEFRARVLFEDYQKTKKYLEQNGVLKSQTQRLSIMTFNKIDGNEIDIRVRITNGESEIVLKKGNFESHNRIEISQVLNKDQFMGMVKIISIIGSGLIKVGEQHTLNYDFGNDIIVSLITSGKVVYLEFEKISSDENIDQNTQEIMSHISKMGVQIIKNRKEFLELCESRLRNGNDWIFENHEEDYLRLEQVFKRY